MEEKEQKDQAEELNPESITQGMKSETLGDNPVAKDSKQNPKTPNVPNEPKKESNKPSKGMKSKLKSKPVIIGLIIVLVVVAVLFLILLFSGGESGSSEEITDELPIVEETPTPQPFVTSTPELIPNVTDAPNKSDFRTFKSDKLLGLAFPGFIIRYPKDWSIQNQRFDDKPTSKVTLKSNGHVLVIEQDSSESLFCLYDDQPDPEEGEFLDFRSSIYKEFVTSFGTLRRTEEKIANSKVYTYCEDFTTYDTRFDKNNHKIPTSIGKIIIQGPSKPDLNTVNEMEEIIKTLEEI